MMLRVLALALLLISPAAATSIRQDSDGTRSASIWIPPCTGAGAALIHDPANASAPFGCHTIEGSAGTPAAAVAALDGTADVGASTDYARADHRHADANRPTDGQKAALAGSSGTPGSGNRYVTDTDARMTDARTPVAHTHVISHVTALQASLDGKADTGHTHQIAHVSGLQTALDGKAAAVHTHPQSDVTNLATDLAARVQIGGQIGGTASSPDVRGLRETAGPTLLTLGAVADGQYLRRNGATLIGATPAGGSDPWTYLAVNGGADFSTTSATAVDVTGLALTPAANTRYELECLLALRTATAATNPRLGFAWSTGLTDGVTQIMVSQAATGTPLFASGNPGAALLTAVGGLPNTTQSWPARVTATFAAGATPGATTRVQLASETAGTAVTVKSAGSFCRYRTYA